MSHQRDSIILSIVSGKGGVGKTALSLSLAHELSAAGNSVVMIDFDFSNRGLSELVMGHGESTKQKFDLGGIFTPNEQTNEPWRILKIGHDIQTVEIPPLEPSILRSLESCSSEEVQSYINDMTNQALDKTGANVAVLDCHGGRDVVSYAAAAISDHVFVVSAPEIITFFGTIRFVEGFKKELESVTDGPKLHLLFNSVMGGFRRKTLSYWYREYFKEYFDDEDFISLIPFDPNISIATSKELFPTQKLYYSAMAEKIRILLFDIFQQNSHIKVSGESRLVARVMRPFIRSQKPVLSIIVDEKVPLRVLIASSLITLLSVLLLTMDSSDFFADNIDVAVFAAYWIVIICIWLAPAFITRSIIEQDAIASGEFGRLNRESFCKGFCRTVGVLSGLTYLIIFFSRIDLLNELIYEYNQFNLINKNTHDIIVILIKTVKIIIIVMCCAFALIFLLRSVRSALFRIWSGESLYRLVVLVGFILACWYLL